MHMLPWRLALALAALAACSKQPGEAPAADSAGKMAGMAMQGMQMMPMMQAHLDSIAAMSPAEMPGMMAAHQEMASRMMDAMGADMRGTNMMPDAAWTALGDSVRRDLAGLPGLMGQPLKDRMEAHVARMRRLMAMHRAMMKT